MSTYATSEREEIPSLYEELQEVPDSRDDQGKRHPLASMLALACVALLCGYQNTHAISEWVDNYGKRYLKRLSSARLSEGRLAELNGWTGEREKGLGALGEKAGISWSGLPDRE